LKLSLFQVNHSDADPARTCHKPRHIYEWSSCRSAGCTELAKPIVLLWSWVGKYTPAGWCGGCVYVFGWCRRRFGRLGWERGTAYRCYHDVDEVLLTKLWGGCPLLFATLSEKGMTFFLRPLNILGVLTSRTQGNQVLTTLPVQPDLPVLPKEEEWTKLMDPIILASLPPSEINRQT
jgi:hypothetical protein